MCIKAIDTCLCVFDSVPNQYKTQKMYNKVVSNDPFILKHCPNRYKTQEMRDKVVDDFLPALKFAPS